MDPRALYAQAIEQHKKGQLAEAERLYRQLIAGGFRQAPVLHLLGTIRSQHGDHAEALSLMAGALQLNPRDANVQWSYANELNALERFEDAVAAYGKAIGLAPRFADAFYNRAMALGRLNRHTEALADFDAALAIKPDSFEALYQRGSALEALSRPQAALQSYSDALARKPANLPARDKVVRLLYLSGVHHHQRGETAEALAVYDKVLALDAAHAAAWNNRGVALLTQGQSPEALHSFQSALSADPRHADAWANLGDFYKSQGKPDAALDCYNKCLALQPDTASALHSRGLLYWEDLGDIDRAMPDLVRAYALAPESPYLFGDIVHLHMQLADWTNFTADRTALDQAVQAGRQAARPFMLQAICQDPARLQRCAQIFAANNFPARPATARSPRPPSGKIRLGYVSGEFRDQATAQLMAGLYESHDRSRFEVVAFDNGRNDESPMRARLERAFDKFIAISGLTDREAAASVDANGIDILVNLNGYFGKARMGLFAQRAAPVQVNYLGFPSTLGAPYIDYIIADRHVILDDERRYFTEQMVTMPDSYQVNDAKRFLPATTPPRAAHGLPEHGFIFCNFNQSYKLTPETFACWMLILAQVDGSVLWLLQSSRQFVGNLRRHASAHGIAPDRLIFAPYASTEEHLTRLTLADLCLDSLPYNAHTTASDALWAGVPLLTCTGKSFAGRVATSLLHAAGMPDLITEDMETYRQTAIALAQDPARLHALRGRLAANRFQCPLFDTDLFRKNLEAAFTIMHGRAARGEAPAHFQIRQSAAR